MVLPSIDQMGTWGKIGLLLQNTANPNAIANYQKMVDEQNRAQAVNDVFAQMNPQPLPEGQLGPVQAPLQPMEALQRLAQADPSQFASPYLKAMSEQMKTPAAFSGTGIEAQALNRIVEQYPAEQRQEVINTLARQRLQQPRTYTDEYGQTHTVAPYDLSALQAIGGGQVGGGILPPPDMSQFGGDSGQQNAMQALQAIGGGVGQAAAPRQYTPQARQDAMEAMQQVERAIIAAREVRSRLENDPTLGGVVGVARNAYETTTGALRDLLGFVPSLSGGVVGDFIGHSEPSSFVTELDPSVNDLAYGLARVRQGGGGRLPVDAVESARGDVNPRGFQSTSQAISKYRTLEKQLTDELEKYQRDLGIGSALRNPAINNPPQAQQRQTQQQDGVVDYTEYFK